MGFHVISEPYDSILKIVKRLENDASIKPGGFRFIDVTNEIFAILDEYDFKSKNESRRDLDNIIQALDNREYTGEKGDREVYKSEFAEALRAIRREIRRQP